MYRLFESFLNRMKARFRSLARATKHEMTVEDLQGDAWIAAHEIGERRGRKIDFGDPVDQELLIGALNVRNVKRPEKHMQYASRIDQSYEDEEGETNAWANRLRAHETSDPLALILLQEQMAKEEDVLESSYSQYAAYVVTLFQFKNDRRRLCAYLVITDNTLRRRMGWAENIVKLQSSLFDRVNQIASDFMPLPGRQYMVRTDAHPDGVQYGWDFDEPKAAVVQ